MADNDFNQSTDYPLVWKGESGTGDMAREMDALPLTELGIALGMGFLTELGIEPLIPQGKAADYTHYVLVFSLTRTYVHARRGIVAS